ncbi:MAG: oligoendopeptidase F [Candidatus Amoebophilus sp. 36-38]|nr:MAG: oligoendopeptidase F [Candidatus Amoebophilus sp. 36-38]
MLNHPVPKKRKFLPEEFQILGWESLAPFYKLLLDKKINSSEELCLWLAQRSELEGAISEDAGWRYIHTTRDTGNETYKKRYEEYITDILPQIMPLSHQLDEKIVQSPYTATLAKEVGYDLLVHCLKTKINLYRPENIPLFTKIQLQAHQYGKIASEMTITRDGKELTMQQAATYLELPDRKLREEVYLQMHERRLRDKAVLDELYTSLVQERHNVARNAGFANFRDYMFVELKRFDYTPQDCFKFHEAILETIIPLLNDIKTERKKEAGYTTFRPWDDAADSQGRPPLQPFQDTKELLEKTIVVLDKLDPFFGDCLRTMQEMGHFDLESRKGKAPGGYNYPLEESGVPFIFMNAVNEFQDVITMFHESGHAIHSFLMHHLPLNDFKHITSEMAELASMSMELLTMNYWELFLDNPTDAIRAKREHLESIIKRLVWIAAIDKFQHWIYENPTHTKMKREEVWKNIVDTFSDYITDWDGLEDIKYSLWQKQLHLFEVPFYYIEYGIAQLGALSIWKNYKQNPKKTLQNYLDALKLGYTKPLASMYETAGTKLDLDRLYILDLVQFVREEWEKLL